MKDKVKLGFRWEIERVGKNGLVTAREVVLNLMPLEGINYVLGSAFLGGTPVEQWYILLFENDYTPQPTDTMDTFPGLAGETTAYANATRHEAALVLTDNGVIDNTEDRAEFEFTSAKTIRGGALVSTAAKGSAAGVLASAVKFTSPKSPNPAEDPILRVTVGMQLVSV